MCSTYSTFPQAKAFDKKTSVLHYLVTLVKRNDESLLEFQKDLTHVREAQNIMLDNLLTEIKDLRQELEIVHKTAQEDADQLPPGEKRPISLKELKEQITLVRCIADVKHCECLLMLVLFSRAFQFLTIIDVHSLFTDNQTDHVTGRTPMERFAMNAATTTETAMTMTEEVKQKYDKVLEYFGEAKDMTSNDFFGTLNRFLLEFSKAMEQVKREENAQLRKLKNAASSAKKFASPKGKPKEAVEKPLVSSARLTSATYSLFASNEQATETTTAITRFGPPLESSRSDMYETTSTRLRVSKPADIPINGTRTDVGKKATTSLKVVVDATAMDSRNRASKPAETAVVAKKWARSKSPTTQDRLGLAAAAAAVAMSKRSPGESDVVVVSQSTGSSMGLTSSNSWPKDTNRNGSNDFSPLNRSVVTVKSDGDDLLRGGGITTAAALAAKKKQLSKSIGNGAAIAEKTNSKKLGSGDTPASLAERTSGDSTRLGPASDMHLRGSASADDKTILADSQGTAMGTGENRGPAAFEALSKNAGLAGGFGISPAKRMERSAVSDHGISALAKNHQVRVSPEIRMKTLAPQTSADHAEEITSDELSTKNTW
jgi:Formin Homology 2 Domain